MDFKLELIVVPVADVDRAKAFYADTLGWRVIVDHRAGEDFRVVQLGPPGSACAIALMRNADAAGSLQGLHLVVEDAEAARAALVDRGAAPTALYHFVDGAREEGPDPARASYNTFFSFSDPDGTGWMVQEVRAAG